MWDARDEKSEGITLAHSAGVEWGMNLPAGKQGKSNGKLNRAFVPCAPDITVKSHGKISCNLREHFLHTHCDRKNSSRQQDPGKRLRDEAWIFLRDHGNEKEQSIEESLLKLAKHNPGLMWNEGYHHLKFRSGNYLLITNRQICWLNYQALSLWIHQQ